MGFVTADDMLAAVGCGDINLGKIVNRLVQQEEESLGTLQLLDETKAELVPRETTEAVSILGLTGLLTNIGRCCNPVPGDPIIGYITRGRGATIHRQDCPNILRIKDKERLIQVSWGQAKQTYPVAVEIKAYDREGLVRDVSTLVSNEGISMSSINVTTKNSLAIFDLVMGISDIEQLSRVLNRLEALPNVLEARRVQPG
jgi:GTP pyrophosphokinase